jgi:hypothetical protein
MGQKQHHRGKHPEDAVLFGPKWIPALRRAVSDLSCLLSRGYADESALKFVGDRFQLAVRQRRAVSRAACSDAALVYRKAHAAPLKMIEGRKLSVDGYNLLISVESALARGVLLRGRDGCVRDMASIHGSYHRVEETLSALRLIGEVFQQFGAAEAEWYFDAPVSNSAKLKVLLGREAEARGWPWRVTLDTNPDKRLAGADGIVVTTDSWILDRAQEWTHFMDHVAGRIGTGAVVIDLGCDCDRPPLTEER